MQRLHWAITGGLAIAVVVLSVLVFRQGQNATKWEYNKVQGTAGVTVEDNHRWKEQLDRMGNDGWEAVGFTGFEHDKTVYVATLLKRPK